MKLGLSTDKFLIAKCKILKDYSLLLKDSTFKSDVDRDKVSVWNSYLNYTLDLNFNVLSVSISNLTSSLGVSLDKDEFDYIFESDITLGLTKEFNLLGFRVLVSNYNHLVLLLKENILLSGYAFDRDKVIVDVSEENGGILVTTVKSNYYIDPETYECTEL